MKNSLLILTIFLTACAQRESNTGNTQKPAEPIERPPAKGDVMCTQDAKQCPDGTWVGRMPPSCAFICPNGDDASK